MLSLYLFSLSPHSHLQSNDKQNLKSFAILASKLKKGEKFFKTLKVAPFLELPKKVKEKIDEIAHNFVDSVQKNHSGKKILIIGGGPIGMINALLCHRLGYKVTVVEKRNSFNRIQVISLERTSIQLLTQSIFICKDKFLTHFLKQHLDQVSSYEEIILDLNIYLFEKILFYFIERVNNCSPPLTEPIQYFRRHRFLNCLYDENHYQVKTSILNEESNCQFSIESDILIGCDGAHSSVRKALGENWNLYQESLKKHVFQHQYYVYFITDNKSLTLNKKRKRQLTIGAYSVYQTPSEKEQLQLHQTCLKNMLQDFNEEDVCAISFYNYPPCICYLSSDNINGQLLPTNIYLNQQKSANRKKYRKETNVPIFLLGDSLCHGYLGQSLNNEINYVFKLQDSFKKLAMLPNSSPAFNSEIKEIKRITERHILETFFNIRVPVST